MWPRAPEWVFFFAAWLLKILSLTKTWKHSCASAFFVCNKIFQSVSRVSLWLSQGPGFSSILGWSVLVVDIIPWSTHDTSSNYS